MAEVNIADECFDEFFEEVLSKSQISFTSARTGVRKLTPLISVRLFRAHVFVFAQVRGQDAYEFLSFSRFIAASSSRTADQLCESVEAQ